jgi:hypothetical protein
MLLHIITVLLFKFTLPKYSTICRYVCERELGFTDSVVLNFYYLIKRKKLILSFVILLKLGISTEALSKTISTGTNVIRDLWV